MPKENLGGFGGQSHPTCGQPRWPRSANAYAVAVPSHAGYQEAAAWSRALRRGIRYAAPQLPKSGHLRIARTGHLRIALTAWLRAADEVGPRHWASFTRRPARGSRKPLAGPGQAGGGGVRGMLVEVVRIPAPGPVICGFKACCGEANARGARSRIRLARPSARALTGAVAMSIRSRTGLFDRSHHGTASEVTRRTRAAAGVGSRSPNQLASVDDRVVSGGFRVRRVRVAGAGAGNSRVVS